MTPPTLPDPRTTPVPPEWQGRQDPIAAVGHSVPHRVVPQLLRPVLAAPLPPCSIPIRTLHDAACCVTSICRTDFHARWSVKSELALLPSLTKLDTVLLSGISKAFASDFDPLCSPALRGITTLDLSYSIHVDGTVLSRVRRLSNLRQLLCRRCSALTSSSLEQIAPLQQLQYLNLSSSKNAVTDLGLKNVSLLKGLTELDIGYNGRAVDASGLRHLASLPQLRSLCVDRCTNIDTAVMTAIAAIPALEELSADVEPDQFAVLGQLTRLTDLTLRSCTEFTDASFKTVATSCPGLTSLTVTECEPFDGSCSEELVALMPRLRKLHLDDNGLSEEY